jgi:NodT family efflux transporter outer membrane factor (OMF) lipoprotein
VGPDFKRPAAPEVAGYTPGPLPPTAATAIAGGEAQNFELGGEPAADWWTLFQSAQLDTLVERSLASNHDLKAARAALTVAHEGVLAQRGAFYPAAAAGFSASRQRQSGQIAPALNSNQFLYDLFTPQVTVSYVPDVFGLNRRTSESLRAQEDAVRYQLAAAYNTLTASVVVAAVQEAALQMQIDATRALIDAAAKMVKILQYQYDHGYANRLDLAAQESQLAQANATLPPLVKQSAQMQDQLAILTGRFPSEALGEKFDLSDMQLPRDLPLSLPSKLVEQRPDVLQAEANLHDASARIGIAEANRLPNIELTADAGSSAAAMNQLFTSGTGFWGLGVAAAAPLFQGGSLLHQERAAKAAYTEAAEQYRSTVMTAFQNVADTLAALEQDGEGLKSASAAADAAKLTLDLAQRQLQDGYAGDLALLNAEQAYQQACISLIQARANRFSDTAALYQALGGGWWRRPDLRHTP